MKNIDKLKDLVARFNDNIEEYKQTNYDESNTRADFIDKFFEFLNWDVYNNSGYSEDFREVVREDKVYIKGKPKSPDYSFRIGSQKQFFVEAKKPSVNIKDDSKPAFQLRRYAYTANLPISILTDFEEFAVYDTSVKPNENDKSSTARIFYCKFDQYENNWEFIFNTFSREAVLKGKLKQYAKSDTKRKGTQSVDKELLILIETWRNDLAKNIALRNKFLEIYQLNEAVQKIIDRIIFLRIAEDRNTEPYGHLQQLATTKDIYPTFAKLFDSANKKYNSGLFKPLSWLDNLIIDDKIFKNIVKDLYYPNPYEFSVLPIEILGHIYEQFLGKTIRLTDSHQAKIEEKPEVRKAGGVYYTPSYIVDYIVKETVGKMLDKASKKDLKDKNFKITILDPACGSGSFLVGAYKYLLNFYLNFWTDKANIQEALKNGKIYQVDKTTFRLTRNLKSSILLNNIYGVDIDSQAVEVTKLSLLLTLMDGEIVEADKQLFFKNNKDPLLPNLEENIKCGNSLIDSSFYQNQDLILFDEHQQRKINTFDWEKEFKNIFENSGFDCIIGNPPYVRQELISESELNFYKLNYKFTMDLYSIFFEKALKILNNNGYFSFIIPSLFIKGVQFTNFRNFINLNVNDFKVKEYGDNVFENVKMPTCVFIVNNTIKKKKKSNYFKNKNITLFNKVKIIKVDELCFIRRGLEIGKDKMEYSGDNICLNGSSLDKYYYIEKYFISNEILSKYNKDLSIFKSPKIMVRETGKHFFATIDNKNCINNRSLYNVKIKNEFNNIFNEEYILGILNSKLFSFYFKEFIAPKTNVFPKIRIAQLKEVPIAIYNDKENHDKLVVLVEQMLETQKTLQKAESDSQKKFAQQRAEILDKQIDNIVYKLYNLTPEEIKIVEEG